MIRLFADSTCDLGKDIVCELGITIIPLYVSLGNQRGRDGIDITPEKIFAWSDETKSTPKTSAFSIADAMDAMREAVEAEDDIIFIGISELMSASCQVVRLAAEEFFWSEHTFVINSKNLSNGLAILLLHAAKLIKDGLSAPEIADILRSMIDNLRSHFIVDTLTYLSRGGRCTQATALLASALSLKPEIYLSDGAMLVGKKFRGKTADTHLKFAKSLKDAMLKADPEVLFLNSSQIEPEIVDSIYEYIAGLNHFKVIYRTATGSIISSHCGPGTVGIFFLNGKTDH